VNAEASNANGNSSINPVNIVGPSFSTMQQSYISTSKAYTATMTTCVAWAFITVIFVMIFAHQSKLHLLVTIPGALLAVGSAGVLTWCIVIQMAAYELSESYAAISFGPGLYIMWAWMICLMLLTPLTAMISIIVVIVIILFMIWIAFLCIICALACLAGGGGGGEYNQDNNNNAWWYSPNNPNGPNYNPT
jgi:hypothetical protein